MHTGMGAVLWGGVSFPIISEALRIDNRYLVSRETFQIEQNVNRYANRTKRERVILPIF